MVTTVKTANSLVHGARHLSKRVVVSYVLDWILILVVAAIGGAFAKIHGNKHAFSLYDPNISFPHRPTDTVPFSALIVVALVGPAVVTALVTLLLVPGPTASRHTPKALIWRRKLWELNTAWMGLGTALAATFMFTEGLKDVAGKPRPDLLARCQPDLSNQSINKYRVGGLAAALSEAVIVVDWHICQNKDVSVLRDGFASWPSGHSSFSWAGMLYLTLWLCAKFNISIPFLAPAPYSRSSTSTFDDDDSGPSKHTGSSVSGELRHSNVPARNQAAAPPIYLLILAFFPIGVASFVCVSRWSDYRHHGFDIISGGLLGAFWAWFAFRWYHLPIQNGGGWSWGARSRDRAFGVTVGIPSYVGDEGWESTGVSRRHDADLEQQRPTVTGVGLEDRGDPNVMEGSGHDREGAEETGTGQSKYSMREI